MKTKKLVLNIAAMAIFTISSLGVTGQSYASGSNQEGNKGNGDAPAACANTLTLNPDGDTTLFEGGGVAGAGGFRYLIAQNPGPQRRPLLHFNLAMLPSPNICDARMTLDMYSAAGAAIENIQAKYIMAGWAEMAAVWPGPPVGAAIFTSAVGLAPGWYNWNMTNAVINWKSGAIPNNGVALVGLPGAWATRNFYSREILPVGLRPQLIIHY